MDPRLEVIQLFCRRCDTHSAWRRFADNAGLAIWIREPILDGKAHRLPNALNALSRPNLSSMIGSGYSGGF